MTFPHIRLTPTCRHDSVLVVRSLLIADVQHRVQIRRILTVVDSVPAECFQQELAWSKVKTPSLVELRIPCADKERAVVLLLIADSGGAVLTIYISPTERRALSRVGS